MANTCKYSSQFASVHDVKIPNWALFMTKNIPNWMGTEPVPK